METKQAVQSLSALAQESRLAIFRLLVQAGPAGLAAGAIGDLAGLTRAGLAQSRQEGRFVIYNADYAAMNALVAFLTENCCQGAFCETPARTRRSA
jgi:ArsR family transcriptional regulator, arsenate/arsenite/antimonite-responsive transcriptional repressor